MRWGSPTPESNWRINSPDCGEVLYSSGITIPITSWGSLKFNKVIQCMLNAFTWFRGISFSLDTFHGSLRRFIFRQVHWGCCCFIKLPSSAQHNSSSALLTLFSCLFHLNAGLSGKYKLRDSTVNGKLTFWAFIFSIFIAWLWRSSLSPTPYAVNVRWISSDITRTLQPPFFWSHLQELLPSTNHYVHVSHSPSSDMITPYLLESDAG